MDVKCSHQNTGFCKFDKRCRYKHPEVICQNRTCRERDCPKRHPKPCRNWFLRKYCKFGVDCMYDHYSDCESCGNLVYLINKETEKSGIQTKEKDDIIAKMAKEIDELRKESESLAKEVDSYKSKDKKAETESKKCSNEIKELKDKIKALTKENLGLKSVEKKLKVADKELEKMGEIESQTKKTTEENNLLKANLENAKAAIDKFDDILKMKDEEIRRLTLKENISEDHSIQQSEEHFQEIKIKNITSSKDSEFPYPCDKCTSTFKTAGLLIKHVKSEHAIIKACELPYPCDKCDSTFKTAAILIKHVKKEH